VFRTNPHYHIPANAAVVEIWRKLLLELGDDAVDRHRRTGSSELRGGLVLEPEVINRCGAARALVAVYR
jgi:hypothetical protein